MPPIVWSIVGAIVLLLLAKYISGWILVVAFLLMLAGCAKDDLENDDFL